MAYLWLKWLHIISVISWMAGVLYLFRIFVYHAGYGKKSDDNHELLKLMAYRLYNYITVPAMVFTWIAGLGMVSMNAGILSSGWFMTKFLLVILMTGVTLYGGTVATLFAVKSENTPSEKNMRIVNEIPTLLMFAIVWLVLFKYF